MDMATPLGIQNLHLGLIAKLTARKQADAMKDANINGQTPCGRLPPFANRAVFAHM